MAPMKVSFYVYADNEEQVAQLQKALNDFVREKYQQGVLVTAPKLLTALKSFGSNYFVTNFLKR